MSNDTSSTDEALEQANRRVRDDRAHCAMELARQAELALAEASSTADDDAGARLQRIHQAARDFAAARPSMAAIANTAARIWYPAATQDEDQPDDALRARAREGEHQQVGRGPVPPPRALRPAMRLDSLIADLRRGATRRSMCGASR